MLPPPQRMDYLTPSIRSSWSSNLKTFLSCLRPICPYISHTAAGTLKFCMHFMGREREREREMGWVSVIAPVSVALILQLWICSWRASSGMPSPPFFKVHLNDCGQARPGSSLQWLKHLPDWQWWNIKKQKSIIGLGWWSKTHTDIRPTIPGLQPWVGQWAGDSAG